MVAVVEVVAVARVLTSIAVVAVVEVVAVVAVARVLTSIAVVAVVAVDIPNTYCPFYRTGQPLCF